MESKKDLKKYLKPFKKYKNPEKNSDFSEKNYIKGIILEERKNNKPIELNELSLRLNVPKELVESIIKELNEDNKDKIKKNPFTKFKIPKIKFKKKIKIIDKEDLKTLKDLFFKIIFFGIPINFALFVITKGLIVFNGYSWIAWGIVLWIIKKELVTILRGIIHK